MSNELNCRLIILIFLCMISYVYLQSYMGPCLEHCYSKPNILLICLIFLSGFYCGEVYNEHTFLKSLLDRENDLTLKVTVNKNT